MGRKRDDIHAAFGCSDCHAEADGRTRRIALRTEVNLMFLEGVIRTQEIWLEEGLIRVA